MDKYLVFRLEKIEHGIISQPYLSGDVSRRVSCFELVKEFEVSAREGRPAAEHYAYNYSLDNKVRTLVIKGSVFG